MSYVSLMVNLQLGQRYDGLLHVAAGIADHFDAGVIGFTASQPAPGYRGEELAFGDIVARDVAQLKAEMVRMEVIFRTALADRAGKVSWRSALTSSPIAEVLAHESRAADLLITGRVAEQDFDTVRHANNFDLLMRAGRPVLIIPAEIDVLHLNQVLVGWKDTREARRAIADGLPFLQAAQHVILVEITPGIHLRHPAHSQLDDVAIWLQRHAVHAETMVTTSADNDASHLRDLARELRADLLIAGASGHSRLNERSLGGVTYDLLRHASHSILLSH
ncbi:universal stress protein [Viridibacterium curvum]|uniref:Universal stress protein n=1 Tax=Viridibacterium curvum TaxID=1101404 RepID=A0ABP9QNZ1_9RHOO